MNKISTTLNKIRKYLYITFAVSAFAAVGHEADFSWVGWFWCILAILSGVLSVYCINLNKQEE